MQAIYGNAGSPWSNEVAATVATPYSAAYEHITASLIGSSITSAKLEWACNAPSSEGSYTVQMRASSTAAWLTIGSVEAADFKAEGPIAGYHVYEFQPIWLQPGTTYQFRVRLSREPDDYYENPSPIATLTTPSDRDRDGISDDDELMRGTDPDSPDTDGDGISDLDEITGGTNPRTADTDSDGVNDDQDRYPNDPRRSKDIPTLQYVRVDLSTPLVGDADIRNVRINDDNKIGFFYDQSPDTYRAITWKDGVKTSDSTLARVQISGDWDTTYQAVAVSPSGHLAGNYQRLDSGR